MRRMAIGRGKTIEHVLWEKFTWFDKYVKG